MSTDWSERNSQGVHESPCRLHLWTVYSRLCYEPVRGQSAFIFETFKLQIAPYLLHTSRPIESVYSDLCKGLLWVILEEYGVDKEVMFEGEGGLVVRVRVVLLQRGEFLHLQCREPTNWGRHLWLWLERYEGGVQCACRDVRVWSVCGEGGLTLWKVSR